MRPIATTCALILSAAALAACGSSGSGKIELAPSGGATEPPVAAATTPKPPPDLASKPAVHVSPASCAAKQVVKKDLVSGTGQVAQVGQTVTVNYVGVLCQSGKEFDSSWNRHQPFTTALSAGSVIPGWVDGISGMRVGSRRELIIPPSLAYGKHGSPGTIPPNSTLVFVVDLLSVA